MKNFGRVLTHLMILRYNDANTIDAMHMGFYERGQWCAMSLSERIAKREATVGVIGLGYVGLELALAFVKAGFPVLGFEEDQARAESVNRAESYITDISNEALKEARDSGRFSARHCHDKLAECDVYVVCVPTPLDIYKQPDLSCIDSATRSIVEHIRPDTLVILESTTYPGTTVERMKPILERGGLVCGKDIGLVFSPERVDPGNKQFRLVNTPKVVGGLTPKCSNNAAALYQAALNCPVHIVSSPQTAEMSKLLENTYRAVNLALVNEFALIGREMGVDIWEVVDAAKTKPFGFQAFYPGPGVGGHCIPLDPYYLAWKAREYDMRATLIEASGDVLEAIPRRVADRVQELLSADKKPLCGAKVLVMGAAYKPDVSDCRESPALHLMEILQKRGAHVSYHDPHVAELKLAGKVFKSVPLTEKTMKGCDIAAIITNHSCVDHTLLAACAPLVLDTRNALRDLKPRRGNVKKLENTRRTPP